MTVFNGYFHSIRSIGFNLIASKRFLKSRITNKNHIKRIEFNLAAKVQYIIMNVGHLFGNAAHLKNHVRLTAYTRIDQRHTYHFTHTTTCVLAARCSLHGWLNKIEVIVKVSIVHSSGEESEWRDLTAHRHRKKERASRADHNVSNAIALHWFWWMEWKWRKTTNSWKTKHLTNGRCIEITQPKSLDFVLFVSEISMIKIVWIDVIVCGKIPNRFQVKAFHSRRCWSCRKLPSVQHAFRLMVHEISMDRLWYTRRRHVRSSDLHTFSIPRFYVQS